MLSIANSTNAAWRPQFLQILPSGHDLDNDDEVRAAFAAGIAWADATRNDLPDSAYARCLEHKDKPGEYFAEQYLRTRSMNGGPVIPKFMRAYCAHRNGRECSDDRSEIVPESGRQKHLAKPKNDPSAQMRQAPSFA